MAKSIDNTHAQRAERYRANQEKRGMKQVKMWLPIDEVERFRRLGEVCRDRHRRKTVDNSISDS